MFTSSFASAYGCSVARESVDEAESRPVADRHMLGEMIEEGTEPTATFEVTLVWDFRRSMRMREHALAIGHGMRPSNVCGPAGPHVVLQHQQLGRLFAPTESCLPAGASRRHAEVVALIHTETADVRGLDNAERRAAARPPNAPPWPQVICCVLPVG